MKSRTKQLLNFIELTWCNLPEGFAPMSMFLAAFSFAVLIVHKFNSDEIFGKYDSVVVCALTLASIPFSIGILACILILIKSTWKYLTIQWRNSKR